MVKMAVVGTGMLVQEIFPVLYELEEIQIVALCGTKRSQEMIKQLCQQYEICRSYADYSQMLAMEKINAIDAVYLAVPNHMHYSMAKKALEAGMHVFVEKPFTSNEREAQELVALARKKRLYLMEAISNQYLPIYKKVRELLSELGDIRIVNCNFSQYSSRYDRFLAGEYFKVFDPACSGGALMDINIYNLHFVAGLFGEPEQVMYYANMNRGVDTSGVVHLLYPGFQCFCIGAKDSQGPSELLIQGTKGYLRMQATANSMEEPIQLYQNQTKKVEMIAIEDEKHRMIPEFLDYANMLEHKDYDQCLFRQEETLLVCRIADQARKSAGIYFPADR